ncbi:hypothetical protein [Vibrio harveyi]|uniref:hypothetical protein n=1 Tax=Vibrio harveyi TaxID=669 RepID=UPI0025AF8CC7|nr:hypothetical protein [Vibrio harveyi]WJT09251.1 hypothetical protein PH545_24810 [Vibrio harveyi]
MSHKHIDQLLTLAHRDGTAFVESTPEGITRFEFNEVVKMPAGWLTQYKKVLAAFPLLTGFNELTDDYSLTINTAIAFLHNGKECRWVKAFDPVGYSFSRIPLTILDWLAYELAQKRVGALSMSYVGLEPHKFNPLISRETLIIQGRRLGKTVSMRITQKEAREIWG